MNAVETVLNEMGHRRCTERIDRWHERGERCLCPHPSVRRTRSIDPLADTPEGWWEFGQILEWAEEQGWRWELGDNGLWWCIKDAHFVGQQFMAIVEAWVDPETEGISERQARIEALAEAVGGTE